MIWGMLLSIDLYECHPMYLNSKGHIRRYVIELCNIIKMKRHGKPLIVYFGKEKKVKGYSLVQLIETSSITGHFVEETNSAFIDIFSCKEFDTTTCIEFTTDHFSAKTAEANVLYRGK